MLKSIRWLGLPPALTIVLAGTLACGPAAPREADPTATPESTTAPTPVPTAVSPDSATSVLPPAAATHADSLTRYHCRIRAARSYRGAHIRTHASG